MDNLVKRAQKFAIHAHRRIDQRRKYSGQPYDAHLKAVAEIVRTVSDDDQAIAAAWLHDTMEDTTATYEELESEFGEEVAHLVSELTDASRPSDGNRAVRKAIDRQHLSRASTRAKTVKLADLIDNCRDIVKHDPKFGRVFVTEAAALLEVLEDGDAKLLARARKLIAKSADKLGLPPLQPAALAIDEDVESPVEALYYRPRVARLFADAFRASDIAEPLRSFDSIRNPEDIGRLLADYDLPVAGIRIDGVVMGFTCRTDLEKGVEHAKLRTFSPDQVIDGNGSLTDVIHILNRHQFCFVGMLGDVVGYVSRSDIQKPLVRMWLFGIVTLVEMEITERLALHWPEDSWKPLLPKTRVAKAETLKAERERRGLTSRLVDCLQFTDKAQLLTQQPGFLAEMGFSTKGGFKRAAKELESLRNHLAHAQDFVSHDWAQVVRMAGRIEEFASGYD
ncbi:MAG: HD domain-containing protein [Chromatiales bacterium]|nr:HD domain-containing protein [Chromatiales bacterium]